MKVKLTRRAFAGFVAASGWRADGAWARNSWPYKTLTFIIPFPPGGTIDRVARLLAPELSELTGKPVVIDNVSGAAGALGVRKLIQANPDGHVLMYGGISETLLIPLTEASAGYSPEDLQAVSVLGSSPLVLVARPDFPARTVDEFIDRAKARPGMFTYASAGYGSYGHLMFRALSQQSGIDLLHVPYRGAAPLLVELSSGITDVALATLSSALPYVAQHKLVVLGVASGTRTAHLPEVPTFDESKVLQDFQIKLWAGVFAPRKLPADVAVKINQIFETPLKKPELRARLNASGIDVDASKTAAQSQKYFESQIKKYRSASEWGVPGSRPIDGK